MFMNTYREVCTADLFGNGTLVMETGTNQLDAVGCGGWRSCPADYNCTVRTWCTQAAEVLFRLGSLHVIIQSARSLFPDADLSFQPASALQKPGYMTNINTAGEHTAGVQRIAWLSGTGVRRHVT